MKASEGIMPRQDGLRYDDHHDKMVVIVFDSVLHIGLRAAVAGGWGRCSRGVSHKVRTYSPPPFPHFPPSLRLPPSPVLKHPTIVVWYRF